MRPPALYVISAAWNLCFGLPLLVAPYATAHLMGLRPPTDAVVEYLARALGGAILLFGVIYWEVGRDRERHRPFLLVSAAAKLLFIVTAGSMAAIHPELRPVAPPILGDLVMGVLFARDWLRLRPGGVRPWSA